MHKEGHLRCNCKCLPFFLLHFVAQFSFCLVSRSCQNFHNKQMASCQAPLVQNENFTELQRYDIRFRHDGLLFARRLIGLKSPWLRVLWYLPVLERNLHCQHKAGARRLLFAVKGHVTVQQPVYSISGL